MPTALQVVQKFFPEVKEVVDAGRNQVIEVTSQDEKTARKKSHKTCAMAVACKRKFNLDGVVISVNRAYKVAPSSRLDRVIKSGNGHGPGTQNTERKHIHRTGGIRTSLGSKMAAE